MTKTVPSTSLSLFLSPECRWATGRATNGDTSIAFDMSGNEIDATVEPATKIKHCSYNVGCGEKIDST